MLDDQYDMTRLALDQPQESFDENLTKFLPEHRIEENKFESYEEAAAVFLNSCHFAIRRRIDIDYPSLELAGLGLISGWWRKTRCGSGCRAAKPGCMVI